MKNRLNLLLVLSLALVLLLMSCALNQNSENSNGDNKSQDVFDGYIFTEESELTLVVPSGALTQDNYDKIHYALSSLKTFKLSDGTTEPVKHEIIFGLSDRDISLKAYRLLEMQLRDEMSDAGYVIYSDGNSLAIAYDEEAYGASISQNAAVECLIDEFLKKDTLKVARGAARNEIFNMIEYQERQDEATIADLWVNFKLTLENRYGKESAEKTTEAMKNLYRVYNDDLIIWLINLYDPDIGGFYYSNSARNTDGYLPDLESTTQALGVIRNSGIANGLAGGYSELLPESMKEKIVKWVKSLQDMDSGYFYHPQWGKKTTDQYPARRGRDLQWARNILTSFDSAPTYKTPLGDKGDGITAEEYTRTAGLTVHLSESAASAVSKIQPAQAGDAGVPEHLIHDTNFINYLNTLNIKTKSYGAGNTLESQALEIVERDKVLKDRGESYSLVEILYNFLNENQNKDTGLWMADGSTDYNAVNGLLKISSTYSKIGKPVPNALVAVEAAMKCIGSEEDPEHVCDVLNPWYAVTVVLENVETYSGDDGKAAADAVRMEIINNAPALIDATTKKVSLFVKEDGSFSYYQTECASNSQGLPTAVPKTNEGDVNATMICSQSILGHIFQTLGVSRIPLYYEADRIEFTMVLEDLGTIIKDEKEDYREDAKGKNYRQYGGECYELESTKAIANLFRADYYITHDTTSDYYDKAASNAQKQEYLNLQYDEEALNTYLEYGKAKTGGYYRGIYLRQTTSTGADCFVFETDIKIARVNSETLEAISSQALPYLCDIKIAEITNEIADEANLNTCYGDIGRIYVTKNENGDYEFSLGPVVPSYAYSEELLGPAMKLGEWNTIAIEIYSNGIAKYFLNNKCFADMKIIDDLDGFVRSDAVRFAFSADAADSAVHLDMTMVGRINRAYSEGDNQVDLDSYAFKAGEYHENFGGMTYNSQPNSDSDSFFRASWYGVWGDTLQSSADKMNNPSNKREGIAMIPASEKNGKSGKVFEYTKGSKPDYYNGVYYGMHNDASKGAVYVFETDFKLGTISQTTLDNLEQNPCIMDITLAKKVAISSGDFDINESVLTIAGIYLIKNDSGKYVWYLTDKRADYSADGNFGAELSSSKWYTLTVEVYENGMAKYYIDGVAMGDRQLDITDIELDSADVLRISLTQSVIASSVRLDNTFFGKVNKTYVANSDYVYTPPQPPEDSEDTETEDGIFNDDFVIPGEWT